MKYIKCQSGPYHSLLNSESMHWLVNLQRKRKHHMLFNVSSRKIKCYYQSLCSFHFQSIIWPPRNNSCDMAAKKRKLLCSSLHSYTCWILQSCGPWVFGVERNRQRYSKQLWQMPLYYLTHHFPTMAGLGQLCFFVCNSGIPRNLLCCYRPHPTLSPFICFGFLMLLSWLWILSFHLPTRQRDCQTPKSGRSPGP